MDTNDYADILSTVVENGRLSDEWDMDELDVEIESEAMERGASDEEIAEAQEYARNHIS